MSEGRKRAQWRFMWRHAVGDEMGATWRDTKPSDDEIAKWKVDFAPGAVWLERRLVVEFPPERIPFKP